MRHPFLLLAPIPSYAVRQCLVMPSPADGEAFHAPSPVALAQRRIDKRGRDVVTIAPSPMMCFDADPATFCLVITPTDTGAEHGPLVDIEHGRCDDLLLRDLRRRFPWASAELDACEAYAAGVLAARYAASWTVDGNTDPEHVRRMVAMFDDGDPEVWDHLPRYPTLSGEYAGDLTPDGLAREITGEDDSDPDHVNALSDAWERGVSDTFGEACEAELRRALPVDIEA